MKKSRSLVFYICLIILLFDLAAFGVYEGMKFYRARQYDKMAEEAYATANTADTSNAADADAVTVTSTANALAASAKAEETVSAAEQPAPQTDASDADTEATEEPAKAESAAAPVPADVPIDFASLQADNPDIYAWISIPDTKVDYPILHSSKEDTDYYLDHTASGGSGYPGSLYTQSIYNGADFTDKVTVIYGHNMNDGSMFGGLDQYQNSEYREKHSKITVYTPTKILTYQVAFVQTYSNASILYNYDCNNNAAEYQFFLDSLGKTSTFGDWVPDPLPITTEDRMIILSTCNGNTSERFLVGAVLTDVQGE